MEVRRRLRALETDVVAQNSATALASIELRPGSYPRTQHGFVVIGPRVINPVRSNARRIFRDNLDHGGRWYGPWWQNIPSAARKALLIDDQTTAEVDFSACQLRLAHAVLGLPDPMRGQVDSRDHRIELYGMPDVQRSAAKSAVLIMLNARDGPAAVKALANQLIEGDSVPVGCTAHEEARRVVDAVVRHFPELAPLWFSDLGLQLQRIDGDICADVQAVFRHDKVVVLSIHDSFIIAAQYEERLRRVMAEAFASGMMAAQKLRRA